MQMRLLVAINNNIDEWRGLDLGRENNPRLPLPYAFGGAFIKVGHELSAIDLQSKANKCDISPFKALHHKNELYVALKAVDIAPLWGGYALRALLRQSIRPRAQKKILYFTYAVAPRNPNLKQEFNDFLLRLVAKSAKGIIVMTSQQNEAAVELFSGSIPVIKFQCGIDTGFYSNKSKFSDVPENYRQIMEMLLREPYVVMPGDELRCNHDAITFVESSNIKLVRISQYGAKSGTEMLKANVRERRLHDRLFVFEKINYRFMRFLLQNASAYAGLVDSTWQPAGWTVACEALSCGLPMVLYEGLVSDELSILGSESNLVNAVPVHDVDLFTEKMVEMVTLKELSSLSEQAGSFANTRLDFHVTSPGFVKQVESIVMG